MRWSRKTDEAAGAHGSCPSQGVGHTYWDEACATHVIGEVTSCVPAFASPRPRSAAILLNLCVTMSHYEHYKPHRVTVLCLVQVHKVVPIAHHVHIKLQAAQDGKRATHTEWAAGCDGVMQL